MVAIFWIASSVTQPVFGALGEDVGLRLIGCMGERLYLLGSGRAAAVEPDRGPTLARERRDRRPRKTTPSKSRVMAVTHGGN